MAAEEPNVDVCLNFTDKLLILKHDHMFGQKY